jgi:hypothetical protein
MKVYIGPYINRWTTIRFERWYLEKRFKDDYWNVDENRYSKLDDFIINKFCDWWQTFLNYTINQYLDRKERKIKIRIDRYDTWSLDHTLSMIALPMLKQLQETKHGSPWVEDEDVPEELKSTSARPLTPEEKNRAATDEFFHDRWYWVLGEMIYAHERVVADDLNDYSGEEGKRIQNGLRLFGKYYQGLWD